MTLSNVQKSIFVACAGLVASAWTSHAQNAPDGKAALAASAQTVEPALATFKGGTITVRDLEQVIALRSPPLRKQLVSEPERMRALLDEMIDFELLLLEAERRGYADHPDVIGHQRDAAVKALIEGPLAVTPESISKADIDAGYAARSSEFNKPAQRRARHVVLATEEEAKALIAELRKAGDRASKLLLDAARNRSLDPATKRQAGELGYFAATGQRVNGDGSIPEELAKAAFALRKEGEISAKPIPTQGGFSVLMLVSKVEPYVVPREQADVMVAEKIAQERSEAAVEALVAELRKVPGATTYPERADAVTLDPSKPRDIPQGFSAAPMDPTAPPEVVEPDGI